MTGPSSPRCPRCEAPNPAGQAFCGSCGLELGAAPPPPRMRRPPAKPVTDLLRPRNIYAVVIVTVLVFLAVTAAGWLSPSSKSPAVAPTSLLAAASPAPRATPAPPSATLAATPPPTATPAPPSAVPAATPLPTATPTPTPSVAQLAAAYLEAATAVNEANGAALATWQQSARTLMDAKRQAMACGAAELVFIRAVQEIPWSGDSRNLARRVLTRDNQRYVSCRSAMVSRTWIDFNVNWGQAETADTEGSAAANELRIALGLPPVARLAR